MTPRTRAVIVRCVGAVAVVGIWFAIQSADVIPKSAITPSAIDETCVRIGIYFSQHHQLPPNLAVLPIRDDHVNRTTDAWNRQLVYSVELADSFTLRSYGASGEAGSQGEGAIMRRFRIVDGAVQPVP